MPYCRLYYHIIWGTRERLPLIEPEIEAVVHSKITEKATSLGAIVYAVGGIENHVHLAVSVPPKIALIDFIGQVKGYSSHQINSQRPNYFGWQNEYGAVTFGSKHLQWVIKYINNQKQHHAENTCYKTMEYEN